MRFWWRDGGGEAGQSRVGGSPHPCPPQPGRGGRRRRGLTLANRWVSAAGGAVHTGRDTGESLVVLSQGRTEISHGSVGPSPYQFFDSCRRAVCLLEEWVCGCVRRLTQRLQRSETLRGMVNG